MPVSMTDLQSDEGPSFVRFESNYVPTSSPMGKELLKFERPHNYDPRKHVYPKMIYKAFRREGRGIKCMDSYPASFGFLTPDTYRMAMDEVDNFNKQCQKIVESEGEDNAARGDGWRDTPKEAVEFLTGLHEEMAREHTFRAHEDRNMSEAAKLEARQHDAETGPVIAPEVPVKRRGRPPKKALQTPASGEAA